MKEITGADSWANAIETNGVTGFHCSPGLELIAICIIALAVIALAIILERHKGGL